MDKLRIDIVSDVVCPWCVIGFINLQKAMTQLSPKVEFEINWNWVKAHSTDELNNEVDLLAKDAANL